MLTELLSYGKPLQLSPGEVLFSQLARDIVELTRTEAQVRAVDVAIDDRTGGLAFIADVEQIRRAITNLIVNGIQASPHDGRVVLIGEIVDGEASAVRVSVTDE